MKRLSVYATVAGALVALSLLLSFSPGAAAQDSSARKKPPTPTPTSTGQAPEPILLVHGYQGSPTQWAQFQAWLRVNGRTGYAIDLTASQDNVANAWAISRYATARGWTRFAIVAWSMGGLSSRYYLKYDGGLARVDKLVLLGSPNYGVPLACFLPVNQGGEMCPSSAFLAALNAAPIAPGPTTYTTITSTNDGMVPNTSSVLPPPATNLTVTGPDHDHLGTDPGVFKLALAALSE